MRMLDLFCGRFGWGKAFAARGWKVVGVDLAEPSEVPNGCTFVQGDIMRLSYSPTDGFYFVDTELLIGFFDFICSSSPCEQFSVHGMKHFHPNPPYPEMGIKLFNHTRALCEASRLPYVMENVRAAQRFVWPATCHAGPFYLWHNFGSFPIRFGNPFRIPQAMSKGFGDMSTEHYHANLHRISPHIRAKNTATIPPELANCVADYAERIIEQRMTA